MATELKERVVVSDSSTSFEVWTKQEYETYVKDCTDAGAAPAYWIITHFDEEEKLLSPSTPLSVEEAAKEKLKAMIRHMEIHMPEKWLEESWYLDGKQVITELVKSKNKKSGK